MTTFAALIVLLLVAISGRSADQATPIPEGTAKSTSSTAVLQLRLDKAARRAEAAKLQLEKKLSEKEANAKDLEALAKLQVPSAETFDAPLKTAQEALRNLEDAFSENVKVETVRERWFEARKQVDAIAEPFQSQSTEISVASHQRWYDEIPALESYAIQSAYVTPDRIEREAASTVGRPRMQAAIVAASNFLKKATSADIANICSEKRQQMLREARRIEGDIAESIKAAKTELETAEKEQERIDRELLGKETAQQIQVSATLEPIFWGFIASVVAAILILRVKSDGQSALMVRERTVVEMLSIAMFLVTVLFLGAGGFIEKSTLGALLGTLGGYLFTRRPTPQSPNAGEVESLGFQATIPSRLSAPVFVPETESLTFLSIPSSVLSVNIIAKDANSGIEYFLGRVVEGEFKLLSPPLTRGATYAVRLAGTTHKGDLIESPSTSVSLHEAVG